MGGFVWVLSSQYRYIDRAAMKRIASYLRERWCRLTGIGLVLTVTCITIWLALPSLAHSGVKCSVTRPVSKQILVWLGPRAINQLFDVHAYFYPLESDIVMEGIVSKAERDPAYRKALLVNLDNVDQTWCERRSLLHFAAEYSAETLAKELVHHGANVSLGDIKPLHLASEAGCVSIVEDLLQHGADVDASEAYEYQRPLHKTCISPLPYNIIRGGGLPEEHVGDRDAVCRLLLKHGADVNVRDRLEQTPLYTAAESNAIGIMGILIENGADVNARDFIGRTPLHVASRYGKLHAVQVLIDKGADVNALDLRQQAPLHRAAESFDQRIVALLLEHGADPTLTDIEGKTPFDIALEVAKHANNQPIIDMLSRAINPPPQRIPDTNDQ